MNKLIYQTTRKTQGYMVLGLDDTPYPVVWIGSHVQVEVLACGADSPVMGLLPIRYRGHEHEYIVWVQKDHIEKVEGNEGFAGK